MIRGARGRGAKQARGALAALLVWSMGAELGPSLHIALHDELAAHTHAGDATPPRRPWLERGPRHAHDHGAHGHDHDHGPASADHEGRRGNTRASASTEERHAPGWSEPEAGHGVHALAHRHLATQAAPLAIPRLVGPAALRLEAPRTAPRGPRGATIPAAARGPPPSV